MASNGLAPGTSLEDVMTQLQAIQQKQDELLAVVDSLSQTSHSGAHIPTVALLHPSPLHQGLGAEDAAAKSIATPPLRVADASPIGTTQSGFTSRIVLT